MKNFLQNWNFMRFLRLGIGVVFIVQGVQENQWLIIIMGSLFAIMPLLNIGCCSTSGCNVPFSKPNPKIEDVTFTEVK